MKEWARSPTELPYEAAGWAGGCVGVGSGVGVSGTFVAVGCGVGVSGTLVAVGMAVAVGTSVAVETGVG